MSSNHQNVVNFHFVAGNPQSESEKRTVRTIVRSNASNRRWRLVRETAAKSRTQEKGSAIIDEAVVKEESLLDDGTDTRRRRQRLINKQSRRDSSNTRQPESPMKLKNLTQYYFGTIPESEVSKQTISRMLQGTAMTYAQLFPSGRNSTVSQMAKDWFHQCLSTRGILHTALFCQAMRAQAARPGWVAMSGNELVLCQTEAVRAINERLIQPTTACDDESIRIVFSLTWHGTIKTEALKQHPRQVPLGDLQSLRLFLGIIDCDPMHARGLNDILNIRGGLDKVSMPGLEHLVSYGDLLLASANLRRPTWPYGSYAKYAPEAAVDNQWRFSIHRTDHPLVNLGNGFSAINLWVPYERAIQLQLVFSRMADYTRATHDFILGPPENRNRAVTADQRNSVQHCLMSLKLAEDDYFEERPLYELCWFAGVAYSHMNVFPLSPKAAQFKTLARLIKDSLLNPIVLQTWRQAPNLALWATVMGALCALGTIDRGWYVEVLKQEVERLNILSWQDLKAQLLDLLWLPLSSDADGEDLWAELEQSGRISLWESPSEDG